MRVTKAVIPVAGRGTRFLPVTHALPKELLPILGRPTLDYVLEDAAASGITEVILVTAEREEKRAIERYYGEVPFDPQHPGVASLMSLRSRVRITTVVQDEPRGLGHAVLCARAAVGDEPFAVLLGDDLFTGPKPATRALIDSFERQGGGGHILLKEVAADQTDKYGIAAGADLGDGRIAVSEMVEKPPLGQAPSRLACVGRYVLPASIFELLAEAGPGRGGEIQLTDGLVGLIDGPGLWGVRLEGQRHDAGDIVGWVLANAAYGLADPLQAGRLRTGLLALLEAD